MDGAPDQPRSILFLCTGNSARSQMAEGFARRLAPRGWKVTSAGIDPRGIHREAIRVMAEVGVDISDQSSKDLSAVPAEEVDLVVTLCDDAAERCPAFPGGVERRHWGLPDPARATGEEEEVRAVFREVRDEIRRRIEALFAEEGVGPRGLDQGS